MSSSTKLPSELLYNIVTLIAVEYLDDVIAGPLALPFVGGEVRRTNSVNIDELRGKLQEAECDDCALVAPNALVSLLCTCYTLRDATLKVLSDILGIPLVADGSIKRLGSTPWDSRIHPIRLVSTNSHIVKAAAQAKAMTASKASVLLDYYRVIGLANTCLTPVGPQEVVEFSLGDWWLQLMKQVEAASIDSSDKSTYSTEFRRLVDTRYQDCLVNLYAWFVFAYALKAVSAYQDLLKIVGGFSFFPTFGGFHPIDDIYTFTASKLKKALVSASEKLQDMRLLEAKLGYRFAGSNIQERYTEEIEMACTRLNEVCAFPVRPNTGYEECQQLAMELHRWVTDRLRGSTAPPRPDPFSGLS